MSDLNSPQYQECLRKAQIGDVESFLALVSVFEKRVYHLAHDLLGRATEAEEVLQVVFLKAAREIHEFDKVSALWSAILKATVSRALTKTGPQEAHWGDSRGSPLDFEDSLGTEPAFYWGDKIEQPRLQSEIWSLLAGALRELPILDKAVFLLRDREDLSVSEICQILRISLVDANSRLLQTRLRLRHSLVRYFLGKHSKNLSGEPRA